MRFFRVHANAAPRSEVNPEAMRNLLQAIVDDNKKAAQFILTNNPELLLVDPQAIGITSVTSKKVGVEFKAETPFVMAQNGRLLGMIKTILPCFSMLVPEGDTEAFEQWKISSEEEQKKSEELLKENMAFFQKMIDAIQANKMDAYSLYSEFKQRLSPEGPVSIAYYHQNEQLLYAARKIYNENFLKLSTDQRNFYATKIMARLQKKLSPEFAKIHCAGIYEVAINEGKITELAENCQLKDGSSFYSASEKLDSLCDANGDGFVSFEPGRVSLYVEEAMEKLHQMQIESLGQLENQICGEDVLVIKEGHAAPPSNHEDAPMESTRTYLAIK